MSATLPRFDALEVGNRAEATRRFETADVDAWCQVADFEGPWPEIPEPLISAMFSHLLGEKLPGHGSNYLKQRMTFHDIAQHGEALTASVSVTRLRRDKALVDLDTRCVGEDGRLICEGSALVLFQC